MKYAVFGITCLVLILGFWFGSSYYREKQDEKYDFMAKEYASTFVRDYSPTVGSDDAKVYLIEFMDPACETCAAFSPFVKKLLDTYAGKIKLVYRYAPFHPGADYFVKILEAARKQGRYLETLDVMYETQQYWASHHAPQPQRIWPFLSRAKLDIERIRQDMNDPAIAEIIEQDLADADALGVRKTPGFFVNGRPLQKFGYEELEYLVRYEIESNYGK